MEEACARCHLKTVSKLIEKFEPSAEVARQFEDEARDILSENADLANPLVATYIQRLAKEKMNVSSLYHEEKVKANALLLANYRYWNNYVRSSGDAFLHAVKLAMAGNIIDYGAHTAPEDVQGKILELVEKPLRTEAVEKLRDDISSAKKILYLGDNAGEIVFDKLLLETIGHKQVTYVVRGKPVINDVTFEDVQQTRIDRFCRVIANGYDAPSTLLEYCSEEFMEAYRSADLIISKGQGNFEGLMNVQHPNMYFLLTAKCNLIANLLNVNVGDLVVKKNNVK